MDFYMDYHIKVYELEVGRFYNYLYTPPFDDSIWRRDERLIYSSGFISNFFSRSNDEQYGWADRNHKAVRFHLSVFMMTRDEMENSAHPNYNIPDNIIEIVV